MGSIKVTDHSYIYLLSSKKQPTHNKFNKIEVNLSVHLVNPE